MACKSFASLVELGLIQGCICYIAAEKIDKTDRVGEISYKALILLGLCCVFLLLGLPDDG